MATEEAKGTDNQQENIPLNEHEQNDEFNQQENNPQLDNNQNEQQESNNQEQQHSQEQNNPQQQEQAPQDSTQDSNAQENSQEQQQEQNTGMEQGKLYIYDENNDLIQQLRVDEMTKKEEDVKGFLKQDLTNEHGSIINDNVSRIAYKNEDGNIVNIDAKKMIENIKAGASREEQETLDKKFDKKIYRRQENDPEFQQDMDELYEKSMNEAKESSREEAHKKAEEKQKEFESSRTGKAFKENYSKEKDDHIYRNVPPDQRDKVKKNIRDELKKENNGQSAEEKKALNDLEKSYKDNMSSIHKEIKNLEKERSDKIAQAAGSDDPRDWVKALIALCGTMAGQSQLYKQAKEDTKFYEQQKQLVMDCFKKLPDSTKDLIRAAAETYEKADSDQKSIKQMLDMNNTLNVYINNGKNPEELKKFYDKVNKQFPDFKQEFPKTHKRYEEHMSKNNTKTKTTTQAQGRTA